MPTLKRADQEQFEKAKDLLEPVAPAEIGFVKSLFFGRIRAEKVLPYPKLDADEAAGTDELIARVDAFMETSVDPDRVDLEERMPQSVIDGLAQMGVLGMTVPREYGGLGFSHTAYCRLLERISQHCASTAVVVGAHQSIGLKALLLMGTDEQKRRFLPPLARGQQLAAFCLSEDEVGSDAANVQTSARWTEGGWIVTGAKKFATNAAIAGMMTVMAKTPVADNGMTREKVTSFIVTPDLPGFEILKPNRSKCGIRGSWQATLRFNNMLVPHDRVLGQVGKGLRVALSVLDYGRCSLSAGCVGAAKKALALSIERATTRKQFGRPIGEFQLIKQKIARMAETTFAMDALTYMVCGLVDRHEGDIMLETAIAKLFCSEGLWQIIDDALQIWGGEGYMRENGIERMMRDARINRIVEGATEVMTAFIALSGMRGVGESFEQVLRASKHPVGNFGRLAQFAREQWHDVVLGGDFPGLHPQLQAEGHAFSRLTNLLAREVGRLLRKYREGILDMQLLQKRIADSAVDLYAMAAVISKLQSMLDASGNGNGHSALKRDLLIGQSFCHRAAARTHRRLCELFANRDTEEIAVADAILK